MGDGVMVVAATVPDGDGVPEVAAVVPEGVLAIAAVVPEGVDEGGFVEAGVDEKITPNHHNRKSTTPVIKMSAAIPRPISNPALIYSYSIFYFCRVKCPVFLCCPISDALTSRAPNPAYALTIIEPDDAKESPNVSDALKKSIFVCSPIVFEI